MGARPKYWAALVPFVSLFLAVYLPGPQAMALGFMLALGLVHLSEDQKRASGADIRLALRRADIPITKAARIMGMDASDLEKALNCIPGRRLDWWRLEMLPDEFWQELWPLLAARKGLPQQAKTFVKALPVLLGIHGDKERSA